MSEQSSDAGEVEDRGLLDELDRLVDRQRVYASFREIGPKEWKEVDAVSDLLASLAARCGHAYRNVRSSPKDPPDCVATNELGQNVAIEVTEFVSEDAVRLNEAVRRDLGRRPDVTDMLMAQWTRDAFLQHLGALLTQKDQKTLFDGPFDEYVVVVHTDEPLLEWKAAEAWLASHVFGPFRQIASAYLLFSYHSGVGYPFVQLRVR